jgi:serine/threonine-protein kinase
MPLTTGSRLGPYEVVSALGAGGMGKVYRAHDSKLNRDVAIKVLPDLFASDPERLARFTREAQTLAALNHPNIAHVYGLEESGPVRALVMEIVEGEDLSVLIERGPMPLAEALPIAHQIADALEAAHEQGIVHRDLKPANIKVKADGTVKVLDFGLAKAMDPASGPHQNLDNSPTLTARATQMGTVLGTAAYMSPEQARGKAVDRRADIWAFGVVLYEMLSGRRAFEGDEVTDVLASVLRNEPDWSAVPESTPASVHRLLRRCLEKDPRKRLSAIGDARLELDEPEPPTARAHSPAVPAVTRSSWLPLAGTAIAAVLLTWAVLELGITGGRVTTGATAVHLSFTLPDGDEVADTRFLPLAVSPDGSRIVYVAEHGNQQWLYLRDIGEREPRQLAGTEGARSPFFSPDGQWIGFFAKGRVLKVAVVGGAIQTVTDQATTGPRGGAWGSDGTIYFAPTNASGLWKVPASGGAATQLTRLDHDAGETSHRWPHALPGGEALLFSALTGPGPDERAIVMHRLRTGERRMIVRGGDTARYLPSGHVLYGRLDALFVLPWTQSRPETDNVVPIALPEQPRVENEGAANFAVSNEGVLAYIAGGPGRYAQRVVWVDHSGRTEALPIPERDYEAVALSPDGRQAVLQVREGTMGLWLYDFARHTMTPFATTGGSSQAAVWSADGRYIFYRGTRNGRRNLFRKAADGSGGEERLTSKEGVVQTPSSVSADGRWLLFYEAGGATPRSSWLLRIDGRSPTEAAPQPFAVTTSELSSARFSPDGRWVAYASALSGRNEIYVEPFPGPGPRVPISSAGGSEPLWSRDGRQLFYQNGDRLLAVPVSTTGAFTVGTPRVLFEGRYRPGSNAVTPFDISLDGKRFLRVQQVQPDRPITAIDVVLNWQSRLAREGGGSSQR